MRFLADECIWRSVVEAIRASGFEIGWVHEISPSIRDEEVLELSRWGEFILITEDGDFGDLVFRQGHPAYAVVRVRLSQFAGTRQEIAAASAARIVGLGDRLIGRFTTIEPDRTRQRPLPARGDDKD